MKWMEGGMRKKLGKLAVNVRREAGIVKTLKLRKKGEAGDAE
jgi:hypothetical protein